MLIKKKILAKSITTNPEQMLSAQMSQIPLETTIEPPSEEDIALLSNAEQEAQRIISEAELKAETLAASIISQAESEKQELLASLEQEKHSLEQKQIELDKAIEIEKAKAYEEGLDESSVVVDELMEILNNFDQAKDEILTQAETEIVSIAMNIAEKLVAREIEIDPESLAKICKSAIDKVISSKGMIKISINPSDLEKQEQVRAYLKQSLESDVKLTFISDKNVDLGSCIIETKGGSFDASFSTQINVIKVALEKYLGHKIFDLDEISKKYEAMGQEAEKLETNTDPLDLELLGLEGDMEDIFKDMQDINDEDISSLLGADEDSSDDKPDPIYSQPAAELPDNDDDAKSEAEAKAKLELEEALGAVDDDLDLELDSDEEELPDPFADDSDELVDERFPEY